MDVDDRLDRIEAALLRLSSATEAGFSGATQVIGIANQKMLVIDQKLGVVDEKLGGLNDRVTHFDGRLAEIIGRLHIIGEQLAMHTHDEDF